MLTLTFGMAVPATAAPQDLVAQIKALLPADYEARLAEAEQKAGISESDLRDVVEQAIDPDPGCSSTPLSDWLAASIKELPLNDLIVFIFSGAVQVPTYDAVFYSKPYQPQYYGPRGEFTWQVTSTFRHLQVFWDIKSWQIQLAAMHGDALSDVARIAKTLKYTLKVTDETAAQLGGLINQLIKANPAYRDGRHPLFTFNSVAYSAQGKEDYPGLGVLPDKIVMGDGVMSGFAAIGLGDVAPQAIMAHEFAHHIQYARDLFKTTLTGPEATRRLELMADAYASYYLSHPLGANMRRNRVQDFQATFYNIGDCLFTDPSHHGTPSQRQRASEWGYGQVQSFRIMSTIEFARRFEQALPALVQG